MARNYNRLGAYIVAAMLTATAGFVGWRVAFPPDVAHFAIVLDRSESPAFPVCETVTSLVRRDLLQPATAKESKLTLIATGDATNSFQGRLVSKSFLPKKVAVIRNHRKQSLAEQTYLRCTRRQLQVADEDRPVADPLRNCRRGGGPSGPWLR